jgi:trehalose 6-phosphate phosphatase
MNRRLFDGLEGISERLALAPHVLLCTDFDGTLTPLVDDPAQAYLGPHMRRLLRSLADHERTTLAFISGRARADLQARIGIPGVIYAGNHGLEISGRGMVFVEPTAATRRAAVRELAADLANKLRHIPGVFVEDKGLTLSIHYRRAAATARGQVRRIARAASGRTDHRFQMTKGNKVLEIRPGVPWNKGTAVHWIRQHLGGPDPLTIYLGDDITDEDAFAALPEAISVHVGEPRTTAAGFRLKGPAEVRRFLAWIVSRLRRKENLATVTEGKESGERET